MDTVDRQLLNLVQKGLPIVENPFQEIAQQLGIGSGEVVIRLERLKKDGYIRRIGAVFDSSKLGYSSMLYAMEVPEEVFYETANIVNSFSGVTHNYRRNNRLNMWFTLSTGSESERKDIIERILQTTGITKIYEFPSQIFFKLNVFFNMDGGKHEPNR